MELLVLWGCVLALRYYLRDPLRNPLRNPLWTTLGWRFVERVAVGLLGIVCGDVEHVGLSAWLWEGVENRLQGLLITRVVGPLE